MLPNFLICGSIKGGSTALYNCLKMHPDIFLAQQKELDFFIKNYKKGINWYEKHFSQWKGQKAVGEATAYYINSSWAPKRIASVIPDVKLICIFRNPIDRLYSHYWFFGKSGTVNLRNSFSQYIKTDNKIIESGFYCEQIKSFLSYFSRDKMHFIINEEFAANPEKELKQVCAFLDVDPNYVFPSDKVNKKYNVTQYPVNIFLVNILFSFSWPLKIKSHFLYSAVFPKKIRLIAEKFLFKQKGKPPMSQKDRVYLQGVYRKPNKELAEFLNKDLRFWE